MINGYGYNNQIVKLLSNSLVLSVTTFVFSFTYVLVLHFYFLGVQYKVISMLCFPSIMLTIDSLFLFLVSFQTQRHMVYFYNQNINGISPVFKIELYYNIIGYAIKCSHFFNLTLMCSSIIMRKIEVMDCMWIASVLGALYKSCVGIIQSFSKYRYTQKFIKGINSIL